jgi:hypothetical protein
MEPTLETMSVKIRPYWSPREIGCIILLLVHAIVFGPSDSKVTRETVNKIYDEIDNIEQNHPNSTLFVLGDFNSAQLNLPRLKQQVNCPTRNGKTLDKCYVSIKTDSYKCNRLPPIGISDHDSVLLIPMYTPVSKSTPTFTTKQIWSAENIEKLIDCVEDTDWPVLLSDTDDVSTQTSVFTSYLNFCISTCIPIVKIKERNDKPWMNGKIRRLVADRCRAIKINDITEVKQLQSVIQRELRLATSKHAKSVERSIKSEPSQAWKSLNRLLKVKSKPAECNLNADELNIFYNRFDKFSDPPFLPALNVITDFFSVDEVYCSLRQVNTRKSCGPDNIPPRLLKIAAHTLVHPVRTLFYNSISQGTFPEEWKKANIVPIPKSKPANAVSDYRPVALTSTLSKCLERLLVSQFQPLVTDPHQFAYRPNRSTEDALLLTIDFITEHLDKHAKNRVQSLFIDFTSAFNTISPTTLVNKLVSLNLNPNIVNWTFSFLTKRQQRVITPNNSSKITHSSTGSPQGCVLSPILFSIYTDEMRSRADNIRIIKFADDTLVLEFLQPNQTSELQYTINNISDWCNDHDLLINASKTKALTFCNARDNPEPPTLTINNTQIETVSHYKYLGTILNSKLKFTMNTEHTIKNTRKKLHILSKLRQLGTSQQLQLNCYRTFIESSLLFHMLVIYHHMTDKEKQDLSRVNRTATKLSKQSLPNPKDVIHKRQHDKAWRLVTALETSPLMTFELFLRVDLRW